MSILPLLAPLPTTAPATGAGGLSTATVDEVLSPYIYVFYAAFLVAFLFTPVMRRVALHYDVVDKPDALRKLHATPIAYLGGAAIFLGWVAGLAITRWAGIHRADAGQAHLHLPRAVVISAAMIVALGFTDDLIKVAPRVKIVVQVLAAGVLLLGGIGAHSVDPLVSPVLLRAQVYLGWGPAWVHTASTAASWLLTVTLVVGCCNATNLMDGLDGLCGGVTAVVAAGFVVPRRPHGHPRHRRHGQRGRHARSSWGSPCSAASLGFVPFNFNPASIFMGDTGSHVHRASAAPR